MDVETHATIGTLAQIEERLRDILDHLRRPDEWGAADDASRIRFGANDYNDYNERGTFKSFMVINDNAFPVFIGLAPSTGRAGRQLFTLGANRFIVIPARGSTVSVGAASAGSVAFIPFSVTMPAAGGDC